MNSYYIKPVTVSEVFDDPGFSRIVEDYEGECQRNPALGEPQPAREAYEKLEAQGILKGAGAFAGSRLCGYVSVLITPSPRYRCPVAVIEGIFLSPDCRKAGPGKALLDAAKRLAADAGAPGVYLSAPAGSRLERIAGRLYTHTNSTYWIPA